MNMIFRVVIFSSGNFFRSDQYKTKLVAELLESGFTRITI